VSTEFRDAGSETRSLTHRAVAGFFWLASGKAAFAALQLLVLALLGRLLTPADFGVVSAALVVIAFSGIISQLGLLRRWCSGRARATARRRLHQLPHLGSNPTHTGQRIAMEATGCAVAADRMRLVPPVSAIDQWQVPLPASVNV
jgi:polysaccharide biosynthesis protein